MWVDDLFAGTYQNFDFTVLAMGFGAAIILHVHKTVSVNLYLRWSHNWLYIPIGE